MLPRKPYASDALMDLVLQRHNLKQELRRINAAHSSHSHGFFSDNTARYNSAILDLMRLLQKAVKRQSRMDYSLFVASIGEKMFPAAFICNPSQAWHTLKYRMSAAG